MQLTDALERFEHQMQADGRSVHTLDQYRRTIAMLARWLAREGRSVDIEVLTPEVIAQFLNSPEVRLGADGVAKKAISVNGTRTSLRVFFRFAHDSGYVATNPARLVRRAICAATPPKALSDAELDRLESALIVARGPIARRDHMLIDLMASTGIRLSSALALDVEDVDISNGELWLRRVKGDRVTRVFLGSDIKDHLIGFLARAPKKGPLFGGRDGRLGKRAAQHRVTHWFELAGVDRGRTAHSLRHSFAMRLLRKTGDLTIVQAALGHRSIAATVIYLHVTEDRLRAALMA